VPRLLRLLLILTLSACSSVAQPSPQPEERDLDQVSPGVIVHLFQWPWASVASECTSVLGPAGVAAVQISPPQEHRLLPDKNFPWYQDYQPVSYRLITRRGDRAAFAAMVTACHAAGIKVYADAVINHMAAGSAGLGSAGLGDVGTASTTAASTGPGGAGSGSAYTRQSFPAVPYEAADFHQCGRSIGNYQDRAEVQNCDLVGLADLATEKARVQERLTAYLNDLISLGVDGFRIDAAKHIAAADLRAILKGLAKPAYVYSEVLFSAAEPIKPEEYRDFGTTLEPRYGEILARHFRGDSFSLFADRMSGLLKSGVIYVDSHDTQRGTTTLSYKDGVQHTLATQLMLAYPYGTPLVMSSFAFEGFDDGPPSAKDGTTLAVECGKSFVCEHRTVLPMVRFRTVTSSAPVENLWATDAAMGFTRAGKGYFAVNRSSQPVTKTVQTGLKGTYTDLLSGQTIEVDGLLTLTIPPTAAMAFLKE
jgi:alpha-amylase